MTRSEPFLRTMRYNGVTTTNLIGGCSTGAANLVVIPPLDKAGLLRLLDNALEILGEDRACTQSDGAPAERNEGCELVLACERERSDEEIVSHDHVHGSGNNSRRAAPSPTNESQEILDTSFSSFDVDAGEQTEAAGLE
uniref:Uncharacterized protein n=1 Tax=Craspedostauros australis TaxID=1486917 RepID=A0A7R9ZR99_9STRA|mmetsp:Transcript_6852/g.18609  ORF Transcript_6852/g.18609 Transcript_6852/m.18609 type:complete len:139 (+) Transcript_6852:198-614(+)